MPGKKDIRSVFCWLIAVMLLVASMSARPAGPEPGSSAGTIHTESAETASQQKNPAEQTTVSPLSLDAVVISVFSYHFSQYFLPGPFLTIRFPEKSCGILPARFSEPLFFFSYFQKIFGKQIAPNAP